MTQQSLPNDTPARTSSPASTPSPAWSPTRSPASPMPQLDWESDQWVWSQWSIRRQVAHIGSFIASWLLDRWETTSSPTASTRWETWRRSFPPRRPSGAAPARCCLSRRCWSASSSPCAWPSTSSPARPQPPFAPSRWSAPTRRRTGASSSTPTPTGVRWHPTEPNTTYNRPGGHLPPRLLRVHHPPVQPPAPEARPRSGNSGRAPTRRLLAAPRLGPQRTVAPPLPLLGEADATVAGEGASAHPSPLARRGNPCGCP